MTFDFKAVGGRGDLLPIDSAARHQQATGWGFGWRRDPRAVSDYLNERRVAGLPTFAHDVISAVRGTWDGQSTVPLWNAEVKLLGSLLPAHYQDRGTCVSHGWTSVGNRRRILQLLNDVYTGKATAQQAAEAFSTFSHAVMYGLAKEVGGDLGPQNQYESGDGAVGAWAAKAVNKWGYITNDQDGDSDTKDALAIKFAVQGVPSDLKSKAQEHGAETVLVTNVRDAFDFLAAGHQIAVCSDQGFTMTRGSDGFCSPSGSWSHCVMPDAWIAGPTFRRAADVKVGDQVYGHDGRTHAVTEVHRRQHHGTVVRIAPVGAPALEVTDEHPVFVYRRALRAKYRATLAVGTSVAETDTPSIYESWRRFEPAWVPAKDVRPGDYLVTPRLKPAEPIAPEWIREEAPQATSSLKPIVPSEDLAWFFGFFIGDGCGVTAHKVSVKLSLNDPLERIVEGFRTLGVEPTVARHPTWIEVTGYSAVLADSFLAWFGRGSENKRIPDWLMTWDATAILDGLVQADGCDYKARRIHTTVSPVLAHQVRLLVSAIGETTGLVVKKPGAPGSYANGLPQFVNTWHPGGVKSRRGAKEGLMLRKVRSVLYVPHHGEVFNYEVEDVHNYVADGFVVHNCMSFIGILVAKSGAWSTASGEGGASLKRGLVCAQSWGPNTPSGPCPEGIPNYSFGVPESTADAMLGQQDSFAIATVKGFAPVDAVVHQYY